MSHNFKKGQRVRVALRVGTDFGREGEIIDASSQALVEVKLDGNVDSDHFSPDALEHVDQSQ